jgi:glycosyltransferase involved in cell wall biosynthesis
LIGLKQVLTGRRSELKLDIPRNMTVLRLPCPFLPSPFDILNNICVSYAFALFAMILKTLRVIDSIYVRDPLPAFGFVSIKNLAKISVVKLGDLEYSLSPTIKNQRVNSIVKSLFTRANYLVAARAGRVCVPSEVFREKLILKEGFHSRRSILIIGAGVDMKRIRRVKAAVQTFKSEVRIGFIGSLAWWQGVNLLVESMQIVSEDFPEAHLLIVGGGEMSTLIEQRCKSLRVRHTMTGFLPHEDALKLLATFYVLVIPSIRTPTTDANIPIKAIEACALGVPVIVTKHGGLEKKFRDKEDLVFCEPEVKDVANKILLLLKNPELREKLSKRSARLVEEFNYDNIALSLSEALTKLRRG